MTQNLRAHELAFAGTLLWLGITWLVPVLNWLTFLCLPVLFAFAFKNKPVSAYITIPFAYLLLWVHHQVYIEYISFTDQVGHYLEYLLFCISLVTTALVMLIIAVKKYSASLLPTSKLRVDCILFNVFFVLGVAAVTLALHHGAHYLNGNSPINIWGHSV